MNKNTKSVLKKGLYIALALSLVLGLILSATYGIFDFLRERGEAAGSPEDVVAMVNGEEIIRQDYSFQLEQLKSMYEMQGIDFRRNDSQDLLRQLEYQALEELINQRLILQIAREKDIQVSQQEVQDDYEEVVSRFDNEEELISELAEMNLTREGFITMIEEQLLIARYLEDYIKTVDPEELEVSEEDLETFYSLYSSQYEDMPDYEEIKEELKEDLTQQKYDQVVNVMVQEIRAESDIQILL